MEGNFQVTSINPLHLIVVGFVRRDSNEEVKLINKYVEYFGR